MTAKLRIYYYLHFMKPHIIRTKEEPERNYAAIFEVNDEVNAGLGRGREIGRRGGKVVVFMRRTSYTRCSIRSVAPATMANDTEGQHRADCEISAEYFC